MKQVAAVIILILILLIGHLLKSWIDYNLYIGLPSNNTQPLEDATYAFYKDKNRLPSDLKELVDEKYLAPHAIYYRSYLRNRSVPEKAIHYTDVEYKVIFDENNTGSCYVVFDEKDLNSYWLDKARKSRPPKIKIFSL